MNKHERRLDSGLSVVGTTVIVAIMVVWFYLMSKDVGGFWTVIRALLIIFSALIAASLVFMGISYVVGFVIEKLSRQKS